MRVGQPVPASRYTQPKAQVNSSSRSASGFETAPDELKVQKNRCGLPEPVARARVDPLQKAGLSPCKVGCIGVARTLLCQQPNPSSAVCAATCTKMKISQGPNLVSRPNYVSLALGLQTASSRGGETMDTSVSPIGQLAKQVSILRETTKIGFCFALHRHPFKVLLIKELNVLEHAFDYIFGIYNCQILKL